MDGNVVAIPQRTEPHLTMTGPEARHCCRIIRRLAAEGLSSKQSLVLLRRRPEQAEENALSPVRPQRLWRYFRLAMCDD